MGEEKQSTHIEPPVKLWLLEQTNDRWITWSGTEQKLREWIEGSDVRAYEYTKTGKGING